MGYFCENIHKAYAQGEKKIEIIRGLDFNWGDENIVGIVGESGSGKTTFLSVMSGLLKPDTGKVVVEGTDLYSLDREDLISFRAKNFGIVFQQYHLLPDLNLEENIKLPVELNNLEVKEDEIDLWIDRVGLSHRRSHFPYQLSGGEQQRVAIARAMIHKPKVLFADEPSGSLDESTGNSVMKLLFDIVKEENQKMLLVTHSMSLAKTCDLVYRVNEGKLHVD